MKFIEGSENEAPKVFVYTEEVNKIIESINKGFTSEITYNFRFRKKNTFFLLPERVPNSVKNQVKYKVKKDYLTGYYIIDNGFEKIICTDKQSFLSAFLSCTIQGFEIINLKKTLIELKVVIDIIVRPPPLSLLDTFIFSEKTKSAWVKYDK